MALRIHHAWLPLVGEDVQIRRHGTVVREGTVDAVAADDSALWIRAHGIEPRRIFHRADGFSVWINYRWETPALATSHVPLTPTDVGGAPIIPAYDSIHGGPLLPPEGSA
jgi:hypothetical protein